MEFDNLKNLSSQAMVAAGKPWVEEGPVRTAMGGIPEVAGCLDRMGAAHAGLLRLQVAPSSGSAVNVMAQQAVGLDNRYDRLARGIDMILAGNAMLLGPDHPKADALGALRSLIFPNGMSITLSTYLEEAGETDLVRERLSPEDRTLLASVPTASGNLENALDAWLDTGNALGTLERERARKVEDTAASQTVSRMDVLHARNQWIRVVRAVLAGLDLSDADENTRTLILQPLALAVQKAARKSKSTENGTETAKASDEAPTDIPSEG